MNGEMNLGWIEWSKVGICIEAASEIYTGSLKFEFIWEIESLRCLIIPITGMSASWMIKIKSRCRVSIDLQRSCHMRMIRLHSILFKKLIALMITCERAVSRKYADGPLSKMISYFCLEIFIWHEIFFDWLKWKRIQKTTVCLDEFTSKH